MADELRRLRSDGIAARTKKQDFAKRSVASLRDIQSALIHDPRTQSVQQHNQAR